MRTGSSPLPLALRADLFAQLATLELAGLPAQRAFASLRLPQNHAGRLVAMEKLLARGVDLAGAGRQSGLFTPLEATLIAAACSAGSPAASYRRLGEHYALQARLAGEVKARLALPALMIVLGLLLAPIPDLAAGRIGAGAYLLGVLQPLLLIAGTLLAGKWLWQRSEQDTSGALANELLALPLFGHWYRDCCRRNFLASLALLAEAGLPLFDAIPLALQTVSSATLRRQAQRLLPALQAGATLAQACTRVPWLQEERIIALITTGEHSGRLPEMLLRLAAQLDEELAHTATQFAAWLPRLIYALVVLWLAASILGSGAFLPQMPEGL
ncbi:type II secretion system F family protein [Chitinilyticum aquatile]|uniref:type II secretion system F family protein n=1 Tax=Chitinilyticum aquatile TaxID=362520 RepID=UPI000406FAC8|nr:type II secretion system F family protein [Chitinilyticum aquatile]